MSRLYGVKKEISVSESEPKIENNASDHVKIGWATDEFGDWLV